MPYYLDPQRRSCSVVNGLKQSKEPHWAFGQTVNPADNSCITGGVPGCQSQLSGMTVAHLLSNGDMAIACDDQAILTRIPMQLSRSRMRGLKSPQGFLRDVFKLSTLSCFP